MERFSLSPNFRPGSTSTNSKSDSFGKNIGSSVVFPNSRRKGETSMPEGKDEKPKSPIRKKPRIESDDNENSHGEGNGESEKDLPGLSQDGISTVHTDDQGNINVTEEGNKTEVSGSTTEKVKIAAPTCAPRTKSAFGSLDRRGLTPNPEYVKAKQQRRSLFHDQRAHYRIWLRRKNILNPRTDSNEDVLIQCVADVLWNRRLAMNLAIPLNHLPSLTIEDRVMRWADAIKNLGVGLCWENFIFDAIPPTILHKSQTGVYIGLSSQGGYFFVI